MRDLSWILAAVLVMALVTYLPRMVPLVFLKKKIRSPFIRSFLYYVPYAVLAAMTFPEIFGATGSVVSAATGLVVALMLAAAKKGLLTVALGSVAMVFVTEQLMRLL